MLDNLWQVWHIQNKSEYRIILSNVRLPAVSIQPVLFSIHRLSVDYEEHWAILLAAAAAAAAVVATAAHPPQNWRCVFFI